jgi:subtilisin family serine protease
VRIWINILLLSFISMMVSSCGPGSAPNKTKKNIKPAKAPIYEDLTDHELSDEKILNWHHFDLEQDQLMGISSHKLYDHFKLTQKREIIVAIIDAGVDIDHEELTHAIWSNPNEIAGNGIDDDKNGYIDDLHGWNFIGGADGSHLVGETLEVTRIYKDLLDKLQAGNRLSRAQQILFKEVQLTVEKELLKYGQILSDAQKDKRLREKNISILKMKLNVADFKTKKAIDNLETNQPELIKLKLELIDLWDRYKDGYYIGIDREIKISSDYIDINYNVDFDGRKTIVADDPNDFSDVGYGNNDVTGPRSTHGTHVAGVIAAKRNNNIGIDGIASNVKIMALRAVPNGDERDKDIALAVRYAADNGAHIINMSFGKNYSPYKEEVDLAFEYAANKGVLLLHAAGNESKFIDGGKTQFPNSYKVGMGVLKVDTIPNWIEVGASTKNYGVDLVASFTNYGKESVTFFSPGHKVYSTTPNNQYAAFSGTSVASPISAGVAALLMSEFPKMTTKEVKSILVQTLIGATDFKVRVPGETTEDGGAILVRELSQTGGIINAFEAMAQAKRLFEE